MSNKTPEIAKNALLALGSFEAHEAKRLVAPTFKRPEDRFGKALQAHDGAELADELAVLGVDRAE